MLHRSTLLLSLPFLLAAIVLPGCGASATPLTPVTGAVSYRGRPLAGGTVVFTPDSSKGTHGPLASAEIQRDGRFTLQTDGKPGAVAGWHRITVAAVYAPIGSVQNYADMPRHALPDKYCCPNMSGLNREVKAGEKNVIHVVLE